MVEYLQCTIKQFLKTCLKWFQVVGDPFGATTHSDLFIRARERGIKTRVVHNSSILNAIGCCGLQVKKRHDFYILNATIYT